MLRTWFFDFALALWACGMAAGCVLVAHDAIRALRRAWLRSVGK
jgi:hypothetical protein